MHSKVAHGVVGAARFWLGRMRQVQPDDPRLFPAPLELTWDYRRGRAPARGVLFCGPDGALGGRVDPDAPVVVVHVYAGRPLGASQPHPSSFASPFHQSTATFSRSVVGKSL